MTKQLTAVVILMLEEQGNCVWINPFLLLCPITRVVTPLRYIIC
jgi:hypothetical protein